MTFHRILLAVIVMTCGVATAIHSPSANAQQAVCTSADGFAYSNNGFNFTPGSWAEAAPPILMAADMTWTWSLSGTGTADLQFVEHPGGNVIVDFGVVAAPATVSHTFAATSEVNYALVVADSDVFAEWLCTTDPTDIPSLGTYGLILLSLLLFGVALRRLKSAQVSA